MRRCLFNLLGALSLVLCLATCVLCALSFGFADTQLRLHGRRAEEFIRIDHGAVLVGERTPLAIPPEATTLEWAKARPIKEWHRGGFGFAWGEQVPYVDLFAIGRPSFVHIYQRVHEVGCPAWAVIALTAFLPLGCLRHHARAARARHQRQHHRCPVCNYDLRASPDRCSECGAVVLGAEA